MDKCCMPILLNYKNIFEESKRCLWLWTFGSSFRIIRTSMLFTFRINWRKSWALHSTHCISHHSTPPSEISYNSGTSSVTALYSITTLYRLLIAVRSVRQKRCKGFILCKWKNAHARLLWLFKFLKYGYLHFLNTGMD